MKINANMSAVLTNNQLLRTENKLTKAMERLSSGLKLNSAEDNPAGMAISNKMKAQIDALDQAEDNATDGVSVLQIADGALSEVHSMLQRMRELSVQAANGTNAESDRKAIQDEIDQLRKEIDRISEDTEYNTKTLLDGSSDVRTYADHATRIQVSDNVASGLYTIVVDQAATQASQDFVLPQVFDKSSATPLNNVADFRAMFDSAGVDEFSMTINDSSVKITRDMTGSEAYEAFRHAIELADCTLTSDPVTGREVIKSNSFGTSAVLSISTDAETKSNIGLSDGTILTEGTTLARGIFGINNLTKDPETGVFEQPKVYGSDVHITVVSPANADKYPDVESKLSNTATVTNDGNRIKITDLDGFSVDFLLEENYAAKYDDVDPTQLAVDPVTGEVISDGVISFEVTEIGAMTIQIGANQYQSMDVRIPEVSAESLYLDTVDVVVADGPEKAMDTLDAAISAVSLARSRIGACQNRLEYAVSSLSETQENMTSAYSTLVDTDMAEAMTDYTQQSVLDQAAISVLSQANQIPQQVLSLLSQ